MRSHSRIIAALVTALAIVPWPGRAETLEQAWGIAIAVNEGVQAQQLQSVAAGLNVAAARAARLPSVRTYDFNAFLSNNLGIKPNLGSLAAGSGAGAALSVVPATTIFGPNVPFSFTFATVPLYTGGRILRSIDAAGYQLNAQRAEEFRSVLDLKQTVAEAYIGILRAKRNLEVARSNVEQLTSFTRDVRNRRQQGMAIRSDELAAEVSLSNARLIEIQARTALEAAWSTYNRYVGRPFDQIVDLDEITLPPPGADWENRAIASMRSGRGMSSSEEGQVQSLTTQALQGRPELAGLSEQARAYGAQAQVTMSAVKPQIGFTGGFIFLGQENFVHQGLGVAAFYVDWTMFDGGASRKRAQALREQEHATLRRREGAAADIALQVRTRWLDFLQARERVPVAQVAVAQGEENIKVITDRYRQQLSTYTEVLDAETRRIQALSNFYNALYDELLAIFRLRRAVGDL